MTIDTLRADHVGAYGGGGETPNLDRLASQGALFEHASAHVPLTRPSHVSLFSGRLPTRTGIRDNVSPALVPDVPLLAEVLRDAGFETAAFVSSVVVSSVSGLDRGFDVYADEFAADPDDLSSPWGDRGGTTFLDTAQKRGDETLAGALEWLTEQRDAERLFLWLHLYDPHDPYEPPEPWASRYRERPYAGEVAFSDELVGRLDEELARLGLDGETLLVVTSDHGEGLGEHGETLHGFFVYESTLAVPLIVRGPGVAAGTRVERLTGLVDLYPTILERAGVEVPAGTELGGTSLAAALAGGAAPPETPLYAESLVPLLHFGWSDLRVVRDRRFKLIQAPRPELYDLAADPGETENLVEGDPSGEARASARALRDALGDVLDRERASITAEMGVSPELLEKLGALGYVGGASPAETATPGADPKDKIDDFRLANDLMRDGLTRLHAGDFAASAAKFEELLGHGIESAELHLYLGRALLGLDRFDQAAEHFRETAARAPSYAGAWLGLAQAHLRLGDDAAALEALADGRDALPRNAALRREEGRVLWRLGRPAEARGSFEAGLGLDPGDARLLVFLGELLRAQGEIDAAVERLSQAVEIEPGRASYWNILGMTLGGGERFDEAERAFREAWKLDPADARYAFNLGLALARQGRAEQARPFFEKALELRPDFEAARQWLAQLDSLLLSR